MSSFDDNLISSLIVYDVALSGHHLVEININITEHKQPSKYNVKRCIHIIGDFKSGVIDMSDTILIGSDVSSCIQLLNY